MRNRQPPSHSEAPSLLAELERRISAEAMSEVRKALRNLVGHRYRIRVREVVYPEELALAVKLLNEGRPRSEAKEILMIRLQISKPKAYRLLDAALNARAVVPPTHPNPEGLRQLALALDDDED